MTQLKVRKVGNSLTVTVPVAVAERLKVAEGDSLYLTEAPDGGYRLTPYDPEFTAQMDAAEEIMRKDREVLRALAK